MGISIILLPPSGQVDDKLLPLLSSGSICFSIYSLLFIKDLIHNVLLFLHLQKQSLGDPGAI